ncbi:hypothetical protein HAX54_016063 [Datura stramonium]|uniref:Uncharacterized protein n=1 Tax=Datura stramonium TaxID=4076 RepID=A0ABS8UID5_DATST|nr:hypothetical protein [Datura stramonium]
MERASPSSEQTQHYYHDPSDKTTLTTSPIPTFPAIPRMVCLPLCRPPFQSDKILQLSLRREISNQTNRLVIPGDYAQCNKLSKWITTWDLISRSHQRVGIGHALTIVCMDVSVLIESRQLRIARSHHLLGQKDSIVPMSVFWLLPQLALNGIGEGFHFPGHIAFYY